MERENSLKRLEISGISTAVFSSATQKLKGEAQFRDHFARKGRTGDLQFMITFLTWSSSYSYFSTTHGLHSYITLHHTLIFKRLGYIITGWCYGGVTVACCRPDLTCIIYQSTSSLLSSQMRHTIWKHTPR